MVYCVCVLFCFLDYSLIGDTSVEGCGLSGALLTVLRTVRPSAFWNFQVARRAISKWFRVLFQDLKGILWFHRRF